MVEHNSSLLDDAITPLVYATRVGSHIANVNDQEWACPQCTLLNPIHANFCEACELCKSNISSGGSVNVQFEPDPDVNSAEEKTLTCYTPTYAPYADDPNAKTDGGLDPNSVDILVDDVGEDPFLKKRRRQRRRRVRMVAGAAGGLVVGSIMFGPFGTAAGAAAGASGARCISKRQERKKDERLARRRLANMILD